MCRRVQRLVSWPDTSLEVLSFQGCRICCVSGKVWFGRQKRVPSHIISSVIDPDMPFPDILLADHNAVPSIAYGTGSVNKGNDIHEYIENALDQGFEHIDTAQCT